MKRIVVTMLAMLALVALATAPAGAKTKLPPARKATVKQVASLVAKYRAGLLQDIADINAGCQITACSTVGRLNVVTLAAEAKTLSTYLGLMSQRSAGKDYLGSTPKELVALVASTRAALDDAASQHLSVGACLNTTASCAGDLGAAYATRINLKQQLEAWSPYVR